MISAIAYLVSEVMSWRSSSPTGKIRADSILFLANGYNSYRTRKRDEIVLKCGRGNWVFGVHYCSFLCSLQSVESVLTTPIYSIWEDSKETGFASRKLPTDSKREIRQSRKLIGTRWRTGVLSDCSSRWKWLDLNIMTYCWSCDPEEFPPRVCIVCFVSWSNLDTPSPTFTAFSGEIKICVCLRLKTKQEVCRLC